MAINLINKLTFEVKDGKVFAKREIEDEYTFEQARKLYDDTKQQVKWMKYFVEHWEDLFSERKEQLAEQDITDEERLKKEKQGFENQAKIFKERDIPELEKEWPEYEKFYKELKDDM